MNDDQDDDFFTVGTYASPRYYIPEDSPAHAEAWKIFQKIKWAKPPKREDAIKNRFNAFSSILWAVTKDENWAVHTDLNKASYAVMKWPTPYDAMKDTVNALKAMGWLRESGLRKLNRQIRYSAAQKTPMRSMKPFEVREALWWWPIVQVKRGKTNLDKAGAMDIEFMTKPDIRNILAKYIKPAMADLNEKLAEHEYTLFKDGKADDWVEVIYRRVFTSITSEVGPKAAHTSRLSHGRLYPSDFYIPSKKKGWRQKTLIDGQTTTEVDVHASSLRLLSEDYYLGFDLPETDDLYTNGKLSGLNREITKKIITASLNGITLDRKSWPKSFSEKEKDAQLIAGQDWLTYAEAIAETYPSLTKADKDTGLDLMLIESDIIISAMNYVLDKGIGCLSIHDCLIVPEESTQVAIDAFLKAYQQKGFKPPQLSVGW
ncbi:hypothetical protein RB2150_06743 [Rhodobacterales bacterium HTCC2150]|nr:hypothetical protein RB2150_06743 [Rhodobacterales bacterium HTCC2150] [Rhodobacteraceae bacterium HTCC2150]